ncbi:MAG: tetratricopeptide repeat protein [Acidobacteriia bacterium]|nr:tetratricopeptide repeat protein [Terriglobia bacterium]
MRATRRIIGLGLALAMAAVPASAGNEKPAGKEKASANQKDDLFFDEAFYRAYQGQYFEAIQRLDTELEQYHRLDDPKLDTLHRNIGEAEFSVGDFELDYRMHYKAGRAIKRVLEGAVDEAIRNEAAFRLARIHFQKDQLDDALQALGRIQGTVPAKIKNDVEFLRANIYMATDKPNEAIEVLNHLQNDPSLAGFVAYNLGIAQLQAGKKQEAVEQLDKAGLIQASDPAGLAIRDKSNLVLGSLLFESGNFERAKQALDRVRLDGPFSNEALLRAGWADTSSKQFDRALVPWNILADREPTDVAVQEALLAVPHTYADLKLYGRAALTYGRALELYSNQIEKVDASINSIKEGRFLKALIREESREDQTWVIRLRGLPGAPETYYLMSLMASHDFQTALHNYLDLEDLRSKLMGYQTSLEAFDDIIRLRKKNYEPLLPEIDAKFRELDSRMRVRLQQRKQFDERLHAMLTAPRPDYLATTDERIASERIALIEKQLGNSDSPESLALRHRLARLRGVLTWRVETEYPQRLTAAFEHLNELNTQVDALNQRHEAFVRTRQAATHSYVGYDAQIARLRERVGGALKNVDILMARQGQMIESVAINQLEARRERLVAQQIQGRFGVADSYDRASRAESGAGGR